MQKGKIEPNYLKYCLLEGEFSFLALGARASCWRRRTKCFWFAFLLLFGALLVHVKKRRKGRKGKLGRSFQDNQS